MTLVLAMVFLDLTPRAKASKMQINKWDIKLKCKVMETIHKMKRQPTKWERVFANHASDKELISKICKKYINQ